MARGNARRRGETRLRLGEKRGGAPSLQIDVKKKQFLHRRGLVAAKEPHFMSEMKAFLVDAENLANDAHARAKEKLAAVH